MRVEWYWKPPRNFAPLPSRPTHIGNTRPTKAGPFPALNPASLPYVVIILVVLFALPISNISSQHIQNTAARVVTLSRKSCHITPILKELHWLPVSQRIVFKLMLTVHKSVNNIAPIYISELLKVYTPSRNLRSSNMSLLKEPTSNGPGVIGLFLSRLRDSGIIFQLKSNLVIV